MLYYWIAYFIVTAIGILHTIFNIVVLHMKSMKDSPGMGDGKSIYCLWIQFTLEDYGNKIKTAQNVNYEN